MSIYDDIRRCTLGGNVESVKGLIAKALQEGADITHILNAMKGALKEVETKFVTDEMGLSDILRAVKTKNEAMHIIEPLIKKTQDAKNNVNMILGTITGNFHDIGKNIVTVFAECRGFNIVDLGDDVDYSDIVVAARVHNSCMVGASGLLRNIDAFTPDNDRALGELGLKNELLISISGPPVVMSPSGRYGIKLYYNNFSKMANEFVKVVSEIIGVPIASSIDRRPTLY